MKIAVLGTRGFPGVQGGVEVHCENLYACLVKKGCEVVVFTRRQYVDPSLNNYKGVKLTALSCPKNKFLEAFFHTFKGVIAAKKIKPGILHIHAVGPSILTPFARALGLKVVVTNHGPEYQRKKWNKFAKRVLQLGEKLSTSFANAIICISDVISANIKRKYGKDAFVIPNGVVIPQCLESQDILEKYSLVKNKYILTVGRFVPEKGFNDLIDAFNIADLKDWKLVIVGRADHESKYSRELEGKTEKNYNIVLTGFLTGKPLQELYSHAGLFVLPSYYEGLPIALLEAMSYGLLCLVSNIPANRQIGLLRENYFTAGNIEQLSKKLQEFIEKPLSSEQKSRQIKMVRGKYNWDDIAGKTLDVYKKVLSQNLQPTVR